MRLHRLRSDYYSEVTTRGRHVDLIIAVAVVLQFTDDIQVSGTIGRIINLFIVPSTTANVYIGAFTGDVQ